MSKTLTNFLIGIGWNTSDLDKGSNHIQSSLSGVKSQALQAGAAIAGAFGARALTTGFASAAAEVGRFSQVYGVAADDVMALGRAIEYNGGQAESAMSTLGNIEKMRAGILKGDTGWLNTAAMAGIDTASIRNAKDATEAMRALADQFQRMSPEQRINAAGALGLDDATLRLLSTGREEMDATLQVFKDMRPMTKEMTQESIRFQQSVGQLEQNIGGVADKISMTLLPRISDTVEGLNKWYKANKSIVDQNLGAALEPISRNFDAIALSVTALAAGSTLTTLAKLAQYIPIIGGGMGKISGVAGQGLAVAGIYEAATAIANEGDMWARENIPGYADVDKTISQGIFNATGFAPTQAGWLGEEEAGKAGWKRDSWWGNSGPVAPAIVTPEMIKPSSYMMGQWDNNVGPITPIDTQSVISTSQPVIVTPKQEITITPSPVTLQMDGKVIDERVISFTTDQNRQAIQDITSTTVK